MVFSLGERDLSSWSWWTQRPDLCLGKSKNRVATDATRRRSGCCGKAVMHRVFQGKDVGVVEKMLTGLELN